MGRRKKLKVFGSTHDGRCMHGYSIVTAESKEEALKLLNIELEKRGLDKSSMDDLYEIDYFTPKVDMLFDGDY